MVSTLQDKHDDAVKPIVADLRPRKKARNANTRNRKDLCNSLKESDLSDKKVVGEDVGEDGETGGDCWVSRTLQHVMSVETDKQTLTMINPQPGDGHLNIFNSERHIDLSQHLADHCLPSPRRSKHRQICRQLSQLKRKIEHLENTATERAGYRPSQADRMTDPEMVNLVTEQARLKREVKNIKENVEMKENEFSKKRGKVRRTIEDIKQSLSGMERKLEENRKVKSRPFDVNLMSSEEIIDEKLDIEVILFEFERTQGAPETGEEKEAMKGLYDRYRSLKMIVNRSNSTRSRKISSDLVPIPEEESMSLTLATPPQRILLSVSRPGPDLEERLPVRRHDMDLPVIVEAHKDNQHWHSLSRYFPN